MKFDRNFFILLLLSIISLFYFSFNLNSWKFSFVGDEWPAYSQANSIVDDEFKVNPFDLKGVFGENRLLGSIWQALFIKLFGDSHQVWRMSNIILIIPINFFFYLWLKNCFNKNTALIATFLLNSSFFIANYFKIGYINPVAFAFSIPCLYFAQKAGEYNQIKDFILLGIFLGLSYYLYIGPLFPFIVWVYLTPLIKTKYRKNVIKNLVLLVVVYLFFAALSFPQIKEQFSVITRKTILQREFSSNFQILVNIGRNFVLFYKNYDYFNNHFIAGAYVDILTGIFVFLGTFFSILKIRKKSYFLLTGVFVFTAVVLGLTSPYSYSPVTRGIFLMPFGFAFAGIALEKLQNRTSWIPVILIIITIYFLNIYKSQIGVFKKTGYHSTAHVIRIMQEQKKTGNINPLLLILSNSFQYNYQNIFFLQRVYGLESIPFSVLFSNNLRCDKQLKTNKILYITYDKEAEEQIKHLPCIKSLQVEKLQEYTIR